MDASDDDDEAEEGAELPRKSFNSGTKGSLSAKGAGSASSAASSGSAGSSGSGSSSGFGGKQPSFAQRGLKRQRTDDDVVDLTRAGSSGGGDSGGGWEQPQIQFALIQLQVLVKAGERAASALEQLAKHGGDSGRVRVAEAAARLRAGKQASRRSSDFESESEDSGSEPDSRSDLTDDEGSASRKKKEAKERQRRKVAEESKAAKQQQPQAPAAGAGSGAGAGAGADAGSGSAVAVAAEDAAPAMGRRPAAMLAEIEVAEAEKVTAKRGTDKPKKKGAGDKDGKKGGSGGGRSRRVA
jgi:hypothetical protein